MNWISNKFIWIFGSTLLISCFFIILIYLGNAYHNSSYYEWTEATLDDAYYVPPNFNQCERYITLWNCKYGLLISEDRKIFQKCKNAHYLEILHVPEFNDMIRIHDCKE